MARKIEMHWVCSACQTENLGRHKKCQNCGDPKDASEPWQMPSDTRAAPTVTDPRLLQQANAGADWQCGYCGSHQRRLDGGCAQCGAAQAAGARVPAGGARPKHPPVFLAQASAPVAPHPPVPFRGQGARASFMNHAPWRVRLGLGARAASLVFMMTAGTLVLGVLGCGVLGVAVALGAGRAEPTKPTFVAMEVVSVHWHRQVEIERYVVMPQEGFLEERPSDAFDIRSLGQAHHHDEQVLDHYETETYWEDVPYEDTETYTDQESCGEDCTSTPESCHEECSSDDNGFASCHDVCSGGGQSCTTRYCSVTRTRNVTRYRQEQRTREVPRYRSEPRYAERFAYNVWRWRHDRTIEARGDGSMPPRWPNPGDLAPPSPLREGERERESRDESYEASVRSLSTGQTEPMALDNLTYTRVQDHSRWYTTQDASNRWVLYKPAPDAV